VKEGQGEGEGGRKRVRRHKIQSTQMWESERRISEREQRDGEGETVGELEGKRESVCVCVFACVRETETPTVFLTLCLHLVFRLSPFQMLSVDLFPSHTF